MKLGVFAVIFGNKSLEDTLKYLSSLGVQAVEIGAGGNPGKDHCDPEILLADENKFKEFKDLFVKYNMEISALSVHGNPVHPNPEIAARDHKEFENAVLLANKLGLDTVITFSGCPGGYEGAKEPNWITCAWPDIYSHMLEYQWNDVLIPYWKEAASFAKKHGVTKIAIEMHPGFSVYNPYTMLKLRKAVGDVMGANFDPSHLWWQGIEPVAAIRALKGAIYHFHAKDTKIDKYNTAVNGVLDTKHYSDEANRSWIFRSVGYGHSLSQWRDIVSELRLGGYDGVLSIEHEDSLMSKEEGLKRAIDTLNDAIIFDTDGEMWQP